MPKTMSWEMILRDLGYPYRVKRKLGSFASSTSFK
jgi:hypothetical protein